MRRDRGESTEHQWPGSQLRSRCVIKNSMPIYEYSCGKCGTVVEKIQKFSDPPLKRHSGCGGALTKLISQSAFHLKGSGWYVTDYARKDSATAPDGEGKSPEKKDTPQDGSAKDTKTPKKADSASESRKDPKVRTEK